ncbi:hypothetical protein DESC_760051 [Desulfosarcina cetonica]|nr:hypothetical protein DESC_760051 [Desulfosarcina cetonica]
MELVSNFEALKKILYFLKFLLPSFIRILIKRWYILFVFILFVNLLFYALSETFYSSKSQIVVGIFRDYTLDSSSDMDGLINWVEYIKQYANLDSTRILNQAYINLNLQKENINNSKLCVFRDGISLIFVLSSKNNYFHNKVLIEVINVFKNSIINYIPISIKFLQEGSYFETNSIFSTSNIIKTNIASIVLFFLINSLYEFYFGTTIYNPEIIFQKTNLITYEAIPYISGRYSYDRLISHYGIADPLNEHYRYLRNLITLSSLSNNKSILITSPSSGEGKTLNATNLSISIANSGAKVVLVEADLRHPHLEKILEPDGAHSEKVGMLAIYEYSEKDKLFNKFHRPDL